jgi:hypothetical protein
VSRKILEFDPRGPRGRDRYHLPFYFNRRVRCYLVTLQTRAKGQVGLVDVVPEGGDRAVPKGLVQSTPGMVTHHEAFLYSPEHAADVLRAEPLRSTSSGRLRFRNLEEAASYILSQ